MVNIGVEIMQNFPYSSHNILLNAFSVTKERRRKKKKEEEEEERRRKKKKEKEDSYSNHRTVGIA